MKPKLAIFVAVLITTAVVIALSPLAAGISDEITEQRTVVDSDGIVFDVTFSESNSTVTVEASNPTDWDGSQTRYIIRVDGQRVQNEGFRLAQGERQTETVNITPGINANEDNHTVTFYTYGNSTQFDFTREIDSTDSGTVPTLYISDVELTTGTVKGKQSTVANVTLVNPSKQLYSTKLMVHTVGTDGSLYPASVRPESSRTITVELLDDRDGEIAGEARLYSGNLTTEEGAMDQVEFAGEVDSETDVWNTSYDPVKPTWMDDNYQYYNASYSPGLDDKLSGGQKIEGIPAVYFVAVFIVSWLVVRKVR